jgi:hypothetical protein
MNDVLALSNVARAYPNGAPERSFTFVGKAKSLPTKIRSCWKGIPRPAYFEHL